MKNHIKVIFFLVSIFFHLCLIAGFICLNAKSHEDARWSGGRGIGGYQVAYVDLGKLEVQPGGTKDVVSAVENQPAVKNPDSAVLKQKSVTKAVVKTPGNKPAQAGAGNSDTPAGGLGSGLDPDGIVSKDAPSVLAAIRQRILKNKDYPLIAKENNWSGAVKVSFKTREDGQVEFVNIVKSSGYNILDQAAVSSVKKAAPLPFYPQVIALMMEYRLE